MGSNRGRLAASLGLAMVVVAAIGAARVWAADPPDTRDARGFNFSGEFQEISPEEQVGLFSGNPTWHRTLVHWPEPGEQELTLSLDYSGSVEHHRFDFTTASGYVHAAGSFGEWSLNLNGHTLWTGNLAPYLFNGEYPGQPHRDEGGRVVTGCWRTCGYSICDHAYSAGGSNADVELALAGGGISEFGYLQNNPLAGNPAMLPNEASSAWRVSLGSPAATARILTLKKPDGTTWRFDEVPLTLPWTGYYFNNNQGPRAFRLTGINGPTPDFQATLTYDYGDSGPQKNAYLHPTGVHLSDQAGRSLDILIAEDLPGSSCQVSILASSSPVAQVLNFSERQYLDRAHQPRHSYLFYLSTLVDRLGRQTSFHYEPDDRSEAFFVNCSDSMDIRANRLTGVDYPTGGGSAYYYQALPATRPPCADAPYRYEDAGWQSSGRSDVVSPMVRRVEIRENPQQAPMQTIDLVYGWPFSPAVGAPFESETYTYNTRVDFNGGGVVLPKGGVAPQAVAASTGYSVNYLYSKFPYRPQTWSSPIPLHWDAKLRQATLSLRSGETHTVAVAYDAFNAGGYCTGTLLPAARTYTVSAGTSTLGQFMTTILYDSLARVTSSTDAAGTRRTTDFFESPGLHSPWTGTGRYMVLLPSRERALAPGSGATLAETWYDRESTYGRVTASHTRLDGARVADRTFIYDPVWPLRLLQATGPMGDVTEFNYDTQIIPNSIYYADSPDRVRPSRTTFHPDAQHALLLYQSYDFEGHELREADQVGHVSFFGIDFEGRPRTLAQPGDVMTGPPPPPGKGNPDAPPYDLTPWPSTVLTYSDMPHSSAVACSFYPVMLDSVLSTTRLDGLGRTLSRNQDTPAGTCVHTWQYDAWGRVTQVSGPQGQTATLTYDELGRPLTSVAPGGLATTFEYRTVAGLSAYGLSPPAGMPAGYCDLTITRHPGGRASVRARDASGNPVASAEYGSALDLAHPAGVEYIEADALGQITAIGPDAASMVRYDYDLAGHRRHTYLPDGTVCASVYDRNGRLAFVQDENGAASHAWTYLRCDGMGRPLEEGWAAGFVEANLQPHADAGTLPAGVSWHKRYSHDTDPASPGCMNRVEVRASSGAVDACDYFYDLRKRVIRKTLTFPALPQPLSVSYAYDRLDRPTSLTYPDGRVINFKFDTGRGLPSEIDQAAPARTLVALSRNVSGQPTQEINGPLTVQWQYGPLGLLDSQSGVSMGRTLFTEAFTCDSDGRRTARSGAGGARWDFTRDPAARLSAVRLSTEPGAPTIAYAYGAEGDLLGVSDDVEAAAGVVSGHRLTSVVRGPLGAETLQYDLHGDLVRRIRLTGADTMAQVWLRFGSDHELLAVASQGGGASDSATYAYDASGWRSRKTVAGIPTFAVRDEHGDLLAEVDSAGHTLREYVRVDGRVVGVFNADGSYTACLTDVAGSLRLGVDASGAVRFSQEFYPFGELARGEGLEKPSLGFLGGETDAETGYCYFRNRYYDPQQGRFISPDPLRGAGASSYGYSFDDPLTYSDPDGLLSQWLDHPPVDPVFTLPVVYVFAHRNMFLEAIRALHLVYGDHADREAQRAYRWVKVQFPARTPRENRALQDAFHRAARDVIQSLSDPAVSRPRLWKTVVAPNTNYSVGRFMLVHEMVVGTRAVLAIDKLKGATPSEIQTLRLKSGAVVLSETTLDLGAVLLINGDPALEFGALATAAVWLKVRDDVSHFTDDVMTRMIPGYANTSILDRMFGPLPEDFGP